MIQWRCQKLFGAIALLFIISCSKNLHQINHQVPVGNFKCKHTPFNSPQQQADSLLYYMNKAMGAKGQNDKWQQKFFCAFPNSFKEMQAMFGYDDSPAPLYNYPEGLNVIQYFGRLSAVPPHLYYNKYIKININGVWEADNIRQAFGLEEPLLNDTPNVCKELVKFSDSEIKSVFYFIFDGPHPNNQKNKALYQKLNEKLQPAYPRLSKQLREAFHQLIKAEDHH